MKKLTYLLLASLLSACSSTNKHLVNDHAPQKDGWVQAVVEIPAGTSAKWEVDKKSGQLVWDKKNGKYRVVKYLPYPGNYGMIPQTLLPKELGGDGDPLDVIIIGPAVERGTVLLIRLIGVLKLLDKGEQDDKLIAVAKDGPLSHVKSLKELKTKYPGVVKILATWFTNYKGPGKMKLQSIGDENEAKKVLEASILSFH